MIFCSLPGVTVVRSWRLVGGLPGHGVSLRHGLQRLHRYALAAVRGFLVDEEDRQDVGGGAAAVMWEVHREDLRVRQRQLLRTDSDSWIERRDIALQAVWQFGDPWERSKFLIGAEIPSESSSIVGGNNEMMYFSRNSIWMRITCITCYWLKGISSIVFSYSIFLILLVVRCRKVF